jgi:hypothetical protein
MLSAAIDVLGEDEPAPVVTCVGVVLLDVVPLKKIHNGRITATNMSAPASPNAAPVHRRDGHTRHTVLCPR